MKDVPAKRKLQLGVFLKSTKAISLNLSLLFLHFPSGIPV